MLWIRIPDPVGKSPDPGQTSQISNTGDGLRPRFPCNERGMWIQIVCTVTVKIIKDDEIISSAFQALQKDLNYAVGDSATKF